MELKETAESRRSIRAYKNQPVEREKVEEIICFLQNAPSWKNSQTGRYYIVMSPDKVSHVKEKCLPDFNRNNCKDAPVLIVTAFEKARSGFDNDKNPVNEIGDEWGAYDLGLQNQLLMLKARELGLDTLIMGIRDGSALRSELEIPDSQEVVAVISLGYRDINPDKPKRKALSEIAKFF
ncbi:MAG: nitroreductase family protein [Lachnospiraceae bacterium]